jgi:hypothetical protein
MRQRNPRGVALGGELAIYAHHAGSDTVWTQNLCDILCCGRADPASTGGNQLIRLGQFEYQNPLTRSGLPPWLRRSPECTLTRFYLKKFPATPHSSARRKHHMHAPANRRPVIGEFGSLRPAAGSGGSCGAQFCCPSPTARPCGPVPWLVHG